VYERETISAQRAGVRQDNRQNNSAGNGGIDRVSAVVQYLQRSISCEGVAGDDRKLFSLCRSYPSMLLATHRTTPLALPSNRMASDNIVAHPFSAVRAHCGFAICVVPFEWEA
jgi:hypothetical protein